MPRVHELPAPPATLHFMGVCGTAMGAVAVMTKDLGYTVTGSDTGVYPPMSDVLAAAGIEVMEGFEASNLDHNPDVVVVGNVVRAVYAEAEALRARDLPYLSLPELLGVGFLAHRHSIVVSGTHGKTTTTSLIAWLLEHAGRDPGLMVGGVVANFDRSARAGTGPEFVIEGDEYDTAYFDKVPKFVHYRPDTAVLTSVELDHVDIYDSMDDVRAAFAMLVEQLGEDGLLIARGDDPEVRRIAAKAACTVWSYGPGQTWDGRVDAVDAESGTMTFTVLRDGSPLGQFTSSMVGEHNLANQVAAVAVATHRGLDPATIGAGLASFRGIKRRQELLGQPGGVAVLDDFAHHPTAVRLTLEALRTRFGGRRLWAIFEPRSATSRRAVFQDAYAAAFHAADRVVLAPPYDTSRIPEDERLDIDGLVHAISAQGGEAQVLPDPATIATVVAAQVLPHDVVAIMSNGGFGGIYTKIEEALRNR